MATQPPETGPTSGPKQAIPAALLPARDYLAQIQGVDQEQVTLISYEQVEWSDACLGVPSGGEVCAQVITPGYLAYFNTPSGEVEIHTDLSGESYRIAAPGPSEKPSPGTALAAWERSGGFAGICVTMVIDLQGSYRLQSCGEDPAPVTGELSPDQLQQLEEWTGRFATFQWQSKHPPGSADQFNDSYILYGQGSQTPGEDQQEEINEFLAQVAAGAGTPTPPLE